MRLSNSWGVETEIVKYEKAARLLDMLQGNLHRPVIFISSSRGSLSSYPFLRELLSGIEEETIIFRPAHFIEPLDQMILGLKEETRDKITVVALRSEGQDVQLSETLDYVFEFDAETGESYHDYIIRILKKSRRRGYPNTVVGIHGRAEDFQGWLKLLIELDSQPSVLQHTQMFLFGGDTREYHTNGEYTWSAAKRLLHLMSQLGEVSFLGRIRGGLVPSSVSVQGFMADAPTLPTSFSNPVRRYGTVVYRRPLTNLFILAALKEKFMGITGLDLLVSARKISQIPLEVLGILEESAGRLFSSTTRSPKPNFRSNPRSRTLSGSLGHARSAGRSSRYQPFSRRL